MGSSVRQTLSSLRCYAVHYLLIYVTFTLTAIRYLNYPDLLPSGLVAQLRASSYEPGNRLVRLVGRILSSVHMGNSILVSELRFQPGYCLYGIFQLVYRDKQGATFKFHPGNRAGVFIWENVQPALSCEHIELSTKESVVRRDLENRVSPVDRAQMKRPSVGRASVERLWRWWVQIPPGPAKVFPYPVGLLPYFLLKSSIPGGFKTTRVLQIAS